MSMQTLKVELGERSYPILIGEHLLQRASDQLQEVGIMSKSKLMIITDQHVAPRYLASLQAELEAAGYSVVAKVIEPGEQSKSLAVYENVMTEAIKAGLDRKSAILALGGGVVGDLAGFVAATYMRGIDFVQMPTSLLAHDSSVGGKVAINHPLGKNLIGAFHQPKAVIYDTATLQTLPKREIAAGFAEVIKHGLIADETFVTWLEQEADRLGALEADAIAKAIYQGCRVKAAIVSADETEQGQRALLNLGHTFGHAFEALSSYSTLNHGEAISIGMCVAARLAERIGFAKSGTYARTARVLGLYHLPTTWPAGMSPDAVLEAMKRDKKTVGGKLALILPRAIGSVEVVKEIDENDILSVMREEAEAK
ncbi:3-dehydroquinate synthase [Brevibacillus panacihumi W25]|uniref:3-dehydroquinate synthase n=1 Tax=Brevibacillus panacihumi W25 TaxID=1408254 RepID=V6MKQ7_9BACL|nr:3-dehydroquinate synthase [Brevibacillus panacihumi]EST56048.1 3-dehydroquinate synthase [Brevibacillus panacihumi W25]